MCTAAIPESTMTRGRASTFAARARLRMLRSVNAVSNRVANDELETE